MSSNAVRAGAAFVELFAEDSKLVRGLRQASARIKKWASDAQKSMQAFGKKLFDIGKWTFGAGAALAAPLIASVMKFTELAKNADELGIDMSQEDIDAAAEFTDALDRLYGLFNKLTIAIGGALAPELTGLIDWFVKGISPIVDWIDKNRELIVTIAKWVAVLAGVGAGLMAVGVVIGGFGIGLGVLGTIIGGIFKAIAAALAFAATGISFLLSPIGLVVAGLVGLAGYFLYTSGKAGEACDWMKESFQSLFGTAAKAWQGISDALAAGRLDLVFKIAWTAIKLVWTQGVNFLYEKWLWVSETIEKVWAEAVYGLSKAFVSSWYGIQSAFTEAVYAMENIWAGFSKGFMDAWKTAERYVAKGIAWIYAKVSGMDASEMMKIVDEGYDQQQKERDQNYTDSVNAAQKNRDENIASIESNRSGTLDALKDDYKQKQDSRKSNYEKQLQDMEQQRLDAEKEFNDAVRDAADVRAQFERDKELKKAAEQAKKTGDREIKLASSGTFNAAATQGLQSQGPMDRIAKSSEETAKNTKKLAKQQNTVAVASK